MYCTCKPKGERSEMIRESYPDPNQDRVIHKWLCCDCGKTEEYHEETYDILKGK